MISEQSLLSGSRTHHLLYPGVELAIETLKRQFLSKNASTNIQLDLFYDFVLQLE